MRNVTHVRFLGLNQCALQYDKKDDTLSVPGSV
jgi:hypothetical protein